MSDSRLKLIAANWKMNVLPSQGEQLVGEILNSVSNITSEILFIPPFTHLTGLSYYLREKQGVFLGAQNCHQEAAGAYTGEISPQMLKDAGVDFVVLGHSERRQYFGEDDYLINLKIKAVLNNQMNVVYCCGEPESVRESGKHKDLIEMQIATAFTGLDEQQLSRIVIAYEPVWAIGTGKTATPEQAEDMHRFIRVLVSNMYSTVAAEKIRILYGGSVNGSNASQILSRPGIDGALVGGASLKPAEFCRIIEAAQ